MEMIGGAPGLPVVAVAALLRARALRLGSSRSAASVRFVARGWRNVGGKAALGCQVANHGNHAQCLCGHKCAAGHGHHITAIASAQAEAHLAALCDVWPKGKFHLVAKAGVGWRTCHGAHHGFDHGAVEATDAAQGIKGNGALPEKLLVVGHGLQRAAAAVGMVRANGRCGVGGIAQQFVLFSFNK